ncbi:hypothetical protein Tco_0477329 [Tanacetum coccineum]
MKTNTLHLVCRIKKNLFDRVSQAALAVSRYQELALKVDNDEISKSTYTQSCLMLTLEGFPFITERISKAKRAKTSKNQQEMKRQVQERDMRKDIKAGSARQQEKKVNEDPIEVKGSIMTSFQKFKGSFGCFESPRTKDVKVRKLVY